MKYIFLVIFFLFGIISTDDSLKLFGTSFFLLAFSIPSFLYFLLAKNVKIKLLIFLICIYFLSIHLESLPQIKFDWMFSSIKFRFVLQVFRIFLILISAFFFIANYNLYKDQIISGLVFCSIFIYFSILVQIILHFLGIKSGATYINEFNQLRFGSFLGEPQILNFYALPGLIYSFVSCIFHQKKSRSYFHVLIFLFAIPFCYSTAFIGAISLAILIIFIKNKLTRFLIGLFIIISFFFISQKSEQVTSINLRSITVVAGVELLKDNLIFGIGVGMSPFYLFETDIFSSFPEFNFSNEFRQNIMNSYVEILVEFGIIGLLILFIFFKSLNSISLDLYNYKSIQIISLAYLISALSVGSVFYSASILFITIFFKMKLDAEDN